jgi:hypothetical protein
MLNKLSIRDNYLSTIDEKDDVIVEGSFFYKKFIDMIVPIHHQQIAEKFKSILELKLQNCSDFNLSYLQCFPQVKRL